MIIQENYKENRPYKHEILLGDEIYKKKTLMINLKFLTVNTQSECFFLGWSISQLKVTKFFFFIKIRVYDESNGEYKLRGISTNNIFVLSNLE